MATPCCQSFIAFLLKFLNFLQTFIGVSIIIYSAYMLNHWQHHHQYVLPPNTHAELSNFASILTLEDGYQLNKNSLPAPWFIYAFMGIGIILCCITCIGHVGAEAVNGCCLCFDLPMDPTGELHSLRTFIEQNMDVCKWIGIVVVVIQAERLGKKIKISAGKLADSMFSFTGEEMCNFPAFSLFLAIVLRALVSSHRINHDMEGDYDVIGRTSEPLLDPRLSQTSGFPKGDARGGHSDIWSSRMREKAKVRVAYIPFHFYLFFEDVKEV
ncbi:hypothetical protein RND71_034875 [Anisodus tanguticus]|uniref:Uncharacterized protein n=1 Tax=Anisodus tanguticus TaxID=243964 RepID=A0AAE1R332_9SOLA|nr:hypothetical protein RND71_034875 [Anisodus tanguticus]